MAALENYLGKGKGACHNLAHDAAGVMSCIYPWGWVVVCFFRFSIMPLEGSEIRKNRETRICDRFDTCELIIAIRKVW